MANVKKQYDKYNNAYSEGKTVTNQRNKLAQMNMPQYQDSYANQISGIYNQIKNGKPFEYDPHNDVAFRRFADEYNALSGLAIAGNQAQAQGLTGGFGSSYAPDVANQGLARMRESVNDTQPMFYQAAQQAYMADNDRLMDMYQAASSARADELGEYVNQANAEQDRYNLAAQKYANSRDFGYQKYGDNRDYWAQRYWNDVEQQNFERDYQFKIYDTYEKLAANKCADYKDAKNNSGMRSYLDGLVSKGKLTKYMADNLYKQYKYTAPKSSGGGSRSKKRTSGYTGGDGDDVDLAQQADNTDYVEQFVYEHQNVGNYDRIMTDIDEWEKDGKLTKKQAEKLRRTYNSRSKNAKKNKGGQGVQLWQHTSGGGRNVL